MTFTINRYILGKEFIYELGRDVLIHNAYITDSFHESFCLTIPTTNVSWRSKLHTFKTILISKGKLIYKRAPPTFWIYLWFLRNDVLKSISYWKVLLKKYYCNIEYFKNIIYFMLITVVSCRKIILIINFKNIICVYVFMDLF